MALFYYISYEQAQRNNSQQVKLFLSQYLNAIRVGYVDVVANASRAVVAREKFRGNQKRYCFMEYKYVLAGLQDVFH